MKLNFFVYEYSIKNQTTINYNNNNYITFYELIITKQMFLTYFIIFTNMFMKWNTNYHNVIYKSNIYGISILDVL